MSSNISRRNIAKGASWAVPAVALASAAPAASASPTTTVTCPTTSCLSSTGGSAPSWTATRAADGSVQLNWTLGTYSQSCVTYSPQTAYWTITPIAVSITTEMGHVFNGTFTTNPADQPFAVSSTASPTLAANFRDYKFGYNSPFSNAIVGFVYQDKPVTFNVTYVLKFRDLGGNAVATMPAEGCVYTASVPAGQTGADVRYLLTSQGIPGNIA